MPKATDLNWLRKQFIAALAADPELLALLVLKGGNALSLVYNIGHRASLDLDYSMEADVEESSALGRQIHAALDLHLNGVGFVLLDYTFVPRPATARGDRDPRWGGYTAEFKLIQSGRFAELQRDATRARRESLSVTGDPQAARKFRIEISKFEFCGGAELKVIDGATTCRVYTPPLIAAEKLRALCQQMDEYGKRQHPVPRARDYYDIYSLVVGTAVEFSDDWMHDMIRTVFRTKEVPLALLARLDDYREFHRSDWPSVQNSIPPNRPQDFDFYAGFLAEQVRKLKPLWDMDAP